MRKIINNTEKFLVLYNKIEQVIKKYHDYKKLSDVVAELIKSNYLPKDCCDKLTFCWTIRNMLLQIYEKEGHYPIELPSELITIVKETADEVKKILSNKTYEASKIFNQMIIKGNLLSLLTQDVRSESELRMSDLLINGNKQQLLENAINQAQNLMRIINKSKFNIAHFRGAVPLIAITKRELIIFNSFDEICVAHDNSGRDIKIYQLGEYFFAEGNGYALPSSIGEHARNEIATKKTIGQVQKTFIEEVDKWFTSNEYPKKYCKNIIQ